MTHSLRPAGSLGSPGAFGSGRLSIALVSEHASPLAALGGVDAGGQNVHVACLAGALADRGHRVTVYTRRDARDLPEQVPLRDGVAVHHVPAGPPEQIPKDELLPHMGAFGRYLARTWRGRPPDLVHSHFWMSGLASLWATRELGLPLLHTYHALGTVKRRHQQLADPSPPQRIALETEVGFGCDRVIATCRDEVVELGRMGIPAIKAGIVPCGVDTELFTPRGPVAERGTQRYQLLQLGRLVPRKGAAVSIAALARLPETELVVVGGPPADRLDEDPEVRRLRALAREAGVADRVRFTGGVPSTDVPRCCAPPTWCCAPRTTSRSASSRWRPWPAAGPIVASAWAASWTRWPTRRPAAWCRPATPRRSPPPSPNSSPTPPPARPAARRAPPDPAPVRLGAGRGGDRGGVRDVLENAARRHGGGGGVTPRPARDPGHRGARPPPSPAGRGSTTSETSEGGAGPSPSPGTRGSPISMTEHPALDAAHLHLPVTGTRPAPTAPGQPRPDRGVGRPARRRPARRQPSAGRGQRGQRRPGPAPHRGTRGPLPAGAAGVLGHLPARGDVQHDRHRQRLRLRPRLRPAGLRARPARRHPDPALHLGPQRQPDHRRRRGPRRRAARLGAHRAGPQPPRRSADERVYVDGETTATVQEAHRVAVHLLCEAFDAALTERPAPVPATVTRTAPPAAVPVNGRTP